MKRSFSGLHPSKRGNLGLRNLRAGYTPLRNQAPVCAIRISANSAIRIGSDCWVRYGSNKSGQNVGPNDDKGKDCSYLGVGDYSPEKAGVGGSTPPLAIKSLTFNDLPLILSPIHRVDIS